MAGRQRAGGDRRAGCGERAGVMGWRLRRFIVNLLFRGNKAVDYLKNLIDSFFGRITHANELYMYAYSF